MRAHRKYLLLQKNDLVKNKSADTSIARAYTLKNLIIKFKPTTLFLFATKVLLQRNLIF